MNLEEVEEPETTRITTKHRYVRKARELPRKMNIEEVEEPKGRKSTSFIVRNSLKSIPGPRKTRELPRKMSIEEVEAEKSTRITYENSHAKPVHSARGHPENTRITTKNEQRRNPFATSDLAPRPVTITVRAPSVNHTVWGKRAKANQDGKPQCCGQQSEHPGAVGNQAPSKPKIQHVRIQNPKTKLLHDILDFGGL